MSKQKVAMIVSNPCDPDYRVVKEAESLAAQGYEVRVFCTYKSKSGIPRRETINDVTYVRYEMSVSRMLKRIFFKDQNPYPRIPEFEREINKNKRIK